MPGALCYNISRNEKTIMWFNHRGGTMKRKLISVMATCMVVTMMTACGNTQQAATQPETAESVQQTTEASTAESTVEATVESTVEESKETQVETQTEETKETVAESTEAAEATSAPEAAAPEYTYTDMDKTMYAQKSVNVRDLPTTDGQKLGALALNQEVNVTGQCAETAWYRIVYNDGVAYVSDKYLGDAKVEEAAQTAGTTTTSTATSVNGMSRTASDYRSISSLSELSEGTPWSTDFNAFSDNYKSIEKVTYTHNGVTVLLYNYLMHEPYRDEVILYDFTRQNFCWCRVGLNELDSIIDAGGISSKSVKGEDRFQSIADFQVY